MTPSRTRCTNSSSRTWQADRRKGSWDPSPAMLIRSLSARLLVLTVFFVMLSEVLIFVPSVARFRMTYFDNHLAAGHLASSALAASPTGKLDQPMTNLILRDVGAHAVILHRPNGMVFMLDSPVAPKASWGSCRKRCVRHWRSAPGWPRSALR